MSDRLIIAEEARGILNEANLDGRLRTFHDSWDEDVIKIADNPDRWEIGSANADRWARLFVAAPDLAATVIAQAEQINRLQKSVRTLLADLNEAELGIYQDYETPSTPPFKPHTLDEYITAEDMEDGK